jgi:hypothetical protein
LPRRNPRCPKQADEAISLAGFGPDDPVRPNARGVFLWAVPGALFMRAARPYPPCPCSTDTSMRRIPIKAALLMVVLALLAACGKHKEPPETPGGGSPEDAVRASLELIRDGRFDMYWRHALPPADFATLRADWPRRNEAESPIEPEDRAKFVNGVRRLTEVDAEKKLFADVRPVLQRFDRDYKDQMPLIAGVAQSMALTAIDRAEDVTAEHKRQLRDITNILGPWVQTVPWGDPSKAREAITVLVDTARKARLTTPEALHALDFDHSMATWSTLWLGLKKLVAVYGLDLDKSFASASVDTLENSGGSARVKVTWTLLDKPIQTDVTLVLLDGRWYDSDLIQQVRADHARLAAPAPAASAAPPAPSATAPARPAPAAPQSAARH